MSDPRSSLKVLFVSQADRGGGAAIAAYRLFQGVAAIHPASRFMVDTKHSGDYRVLGPRSKVARFWSLLKPEREKLLLLRYRRRSEHIFSPSLVDNPALVEAINRFSPDVVHLHWVQKGVLSIPDLARIRAPLVWTMHDSWVFTGGCHLPYDCLRYQTTCGTCPHLGSQSPHDLSFRVLKTKRKAWQHLGFHVITPSRWLGAKSSASLVLQGKPVHVIPNGMDLDLFKPLEKAVAKKLLGLDPSKRYLAFGAMEATSDTNKGFDLLQRVLMQFSQGRQADNVEALIIGAARPENPAPMGIPVHYLGRISDEVTMVVALSAASVVLVPSRSENFPNMIAEGLACGTPGLAFSIGGCGDLIDHQSNGYLAEPYSIESYLAGLLWILDQSPEVIGKTARKKAEDLLNLDEIAHRHCELYHELAESRGHHD